MRDRVKETAGQVEVTRVRKEQRKKNSTIREPNRERERE